MALSRRLLAPIVELRENESGIAVLMFAYSFLAMTAYNIIQPITRSRFISSLGADNLPYVLLVSVFIVGVIMQGYSRLGGLVPPKWVVPVTQGAMVALLVGFWMAAGWGWTSVDVALLPVRPDLRNPAHQPVLDAGQHHLRPAPGEAAVRVHRRRGKPRRASPAAASLACSPARVGNANLMLVSAGVLALVRCRRVADRPTVAQRPTLPAWSEAGKEEGVSSGEAHADAAPEPSPADHRRRDRDDLDRRRPHRPAAEHGHRGCEGSQGTDAMTAVLADVQVYTSMIGFVIQVWLTSKIQRFLGIGFALDDPADRASDRPRC